MKMSKAKLKVLQAVIELIVAAVVFGTSCFAWFASNKKTTVEGMSIQVKCEDNLHFYNLVTAVRYYKSGATLTNIYDVSSGSLKLVAWSFADNGSDEKKPTQTVNDDFLFSKMLPGEYVDVTVSAYMTNSSDSGYEFYLSDFGIQEDNTFSFHKTTVEEEELTTTKGTTSYGVLPVFQYGVVEISTTGEESVSLSYFHNDYLEETGNSEKNIFEYYEDTNYGISSDSNYSVKIYGWSTANCDANGAGNVTFDTSKTDEVDDVTACYSWSASGTLTADDCEELYEVGAVTFRIQTNFDEYYTFLNSRTTGAEGSGNDWDYSNYISNKKLTIGSFVLRNDTSSSEGGD